MKQFKFSMGNLLNIWIALILIVIFTQKSSAALVPTVITDTPLQLNISWTWDGEDSSQSSALNYWDVYLEFSERLNYTIRSTHLVDSDAPGENRFPNSFGSMGGFAFWILGQNQFVPAPYGVLIDRDIDVTHEFVSGYEPSAIDGLYRLVVSSAIDKYHFYLYHDEDPAKTIIQLTATHMSSVPIPGTIWFLGFGLFGVVYLKKYKIKHRRTK